MFQNILMLGVFIMIFRVQIHEEAMKKSMSQLRDERKKKISRHPDVLYIENIVKHKGCYILI